MKAYLALESKTGSEPTLFEGTWIGAQRGKLSELKGVGKGYGELVFNTGMSGYQEVLTDPSYFGQIITFTYPHIGNTGINPEDFESRKIFCAGLVVHELCEKPSNHRSTNTLQSFLESQGISGIQGVDTRALTLMLRQNGVTRAILLSEKDISSGLSPAKVATDFFKSHETFLDENWIARVSTETPYHFPGSEKGSYPVAVLDFGIKTNLLRELAERDCSLTVYPWNTSAAKLLASKPKGIFLSNGPGDPSLAKEAIETVKQLLGQVPIFGVCMGHQVLALALGAKTYKLTFGHRGVNHPVKDLKTGKIEITSQNHGYAVEAKDFADHTQITHISLNDQTVEGLSVPHSRAFSVQYHPESSPGPHDSRELFDRFIAEIKLS